jgi:heme/copper-type cytochrome/quinol oxidase subunit 3
MRPAGRLMWVAAGLGIVFLCLKGIEYAEEISEQLWPGPNFSLDIAERRIGEIFYFFYWLITGIHALHLLIGVAALALIGRRGRVVRSTTVSKTGFSFAAASWSIEVPVRCPLRASAWAYRW